MGNFIGGIAGDIIGSVYEWHNVRSVDDIKFFKSGSRATDDTVLTCAVAKWLIDDEKHEVKTLAKILKKFALKHPFAGYGGKFKKWLYSDSYEPIGSFGNGAGMRVSPVGYYANSIEEVLELAKKSAEVTHNHEEGIKGAQAIALAVYLASFGYPYTKEKIKEELETRFGYDLNRHVSDFVTLNEKGEVVSRAHKFDATCQVTVPEAIIAFLDGEDYEDAIYKALFIGGDSDTIADMTGAIAGAYYGVPQFVVNQAMAHLPKDMFDVVMKFEEKIAEKLRKTDKYLETNADRD